MSDLAVRVLDLIQQRESEASRLARFLHDEVGQILTGAGLELEALRRSTTDPQMQSGLSAVQTLLEGAISQIRGLSHSLSPSALDRLGLGFALQELVNRYRQPGSVTIRLLIDGRPQPSPVATAGFYRIAAQALDNAVKHSKATLIEVILRRTGRGVEMEIRDNGAGFDWEVQRQHPSGFGLQLMSLSAQHDGLDFEIRTRPGTFTIVFVLEKPASPCLSVS